MSYKSPAEQEKARKEREEFLKKEQLVSKHSSEIENLMSKRYTTIDAFEDYKENKISKSDYEKIFKKFHNVFFVILIVKFYIQFLIVLITQLQLLTYPQ